MSGENISAPAAGDAANTAPRHPFAALPDPLVIEGKLRSAGLGSGKASHIPDDRECFALWDKYGMWENIRAHSRKVALICEALAARALEVGFNVSVRQARSAGLLHDLAKTRCLEYGGSHAQLGAAWVLLETGDYVLAQATLLHVHWAWPLPEPGRICRLPFFLQYADKRVMHDRIVRLGERFEDLQKRYGLTEKARAGINATLSQTREMEAKLSAGLGWNLDEHSFD